MILDWVLTNVQSAVLSRGVFDTINNLDHKPVFIKLNLSLKYRIVSEPFLYGTIIMGTFPV